MIIPENASTRLARRIFILSSVFRRFILGPVTPATLLEHINHLPHHRATFRQLLRETHLDRDALQSRLDELLKRGEIIETRADQFAAIAGSREYAAGRISMHRDGYGFLVPDRPIEGLRGDVFLGERETAGAMNGDRAIVRINRIERDGKADGEVIRILKRAHPSVVGEFRITRRGMFVAPHDDRIQNWIEIPENMAIPPEPPAPDRIGGKSYTIKRGDSPVPADGSGAGTSNFAINDPSDLDGMIVNAEVLEYETGGERAVGRIVEVLGHPDDFGIDVEITIRQHQLPHHFPPAAIEEAQGVPQAIGKAELDGRRDFRDLPIVTIDGETARDFDDAVYVERLPNGNYALQVHIADVSHYVLPDSAIDREARLRGTSVYFPDRAVPMLPFELSTEICSLKPQADRLVMSALLELDHNGGVIGQEFCRGVIRSAERMTYTSVHLLLEGDTAMRERYQPLVERFELMKELALILNRKRSKRGSIDFDLPEPLIEFDANGIMIGVSRSPRNIAHRIIEEFMLAANEAVAEHIENAGVPSIYRIHELPDPKRVMEFEEVATHFGYSLGVGAIPVKKFSYTERKRSGQHESKVRREIVVPEGGLKISPRHYQKLVAKLEGKPEERILNYLMLRSLKQARYSAENTGHFALAASHYTHFTSPIRRYPDLMVHRVLGALLDGTKYGDEAEMATVAEDCSFTERRAAEAERDLVEWKKVKFMVSRVGEEFPGLIISTAKFGFFVELEDLFIEGLVPMDSLPGDRYTYHENTRRVVGQRTRREFSIGDKATVMLDRVDEAEKKLQFSLVEEVKRKRKNIGPRMNANKRE
jgi:ribonuclease R